uniref:Bm11833 n=1 Tax=Brugia malayi TaxID=6279 RepID=A0A1I9GAA2_BRUMA|nr:Bm11833 [Brugia malayi]
MISLKAVYLAGLAVNSRSLQDKDTKPRFWPAEEAEAFCTQQGLENGATMIPEKEESLSARLGEKLSSTKHTSILNLYG